MIVWSGRGYLVVLVVIASLLLTNLVVDASFGVKGYYDTHSWPPLVAMWAAALVVYYLQPFISGKSRLLTDTATGEKVEVNRGGTVFFIPVRYWPMVLFVLGAAWGLFNLSTKR